MDGPILNDHLTSNANSLWQKELEKELYSSMGTHPLLATGCQAISAPALYESLNFKTG